MDFGTESSAVPSSSEESPVVHRRRSSLYKSVPLRADCLGNGIQPSSSQAESGSKEDCNLEYHINLEYINKLKEENEEWKKILKEMKKENLRVRNHGKPSTLTLESCADILTEEDLHFLKDTPNYQKIFNDLDTLIEMSAISSRMDQKMMNSLQNMISRTKQLEESTKKYLLQLD
ncbi:uncharacterized protein [Anabrus simplex]|uniref:uncharacterized protein isoform X2 n=1 Tax=Anabrus simplex TaxID=316456 RepID=UPI0034DD5EA4